ncbi:MAG: nucleotidyl transferase AbiEii/AbiGii toxin family protein [Synergistaceae bacterium]|jgi:hypothetical protein|nr:nucleotidyl transferase AbiEii/AbiGii toxin family protein [Synergistaceae bacterium]
MKQFNPRVDILPDAQKALWNELSPCKDLGFVLYGGTAIALQIGHRSSVDFDFFSHLPLDEKKEKKVLSALPFLNTSERIQVTQNTRSYLTATNVKFSFFGCIHLGRIGEPLTTDDGVLQVASLDDLMAMKLATILQRVEAKDYKDLAAMLKNGMSLEKGLAGALTLYGKQFPPSESLKAMTYFHGGDLQKLSQPDKETLLLASRTLSVRELPQVKLLSKDLTASRCPAV